MFQSGIDVYQMESYMHHVLSLKYGGPGVCRWCGKEVSNKAFHEIRCDKRNEHANIEMAEEKTDAGS